MAVLGVLSIAVGLGMVLGVWACLVTLGVALVGSAVAIEIPDSQ